MALVNTMTVGSSTLVFTRKLEDSDLAKKTAKSVYEAEGAGGVLFTVEVANDYKKRSRHHLKLRQDNRANGANPASSRQIAVTIDHADSVTESPVDENNINLVFGLMGFFANGDNVRAFLQGNI